jgi:hypothetical protein
MKDDIHSSDGAATHRPLAEITTQELDVVFEAGEIGFAPRAEIVYDPDEVSEFDQTRGEMRTDEAGAPRYQAF